MAEPQGFVRPTNWNIYTPAEKAKEYERQGYVQDSNGNWVKASVSDAAKTKAEQETKSANARNDARAKLAAQNEKAKKIEEARNKLREKMTIQKKWDQHIADWLQSAKGKTQEQEKSAAINALNNPESNPVPPPQNKPPAQQSAEETSKDADAKADTKSDTKPKEQENFGRSSSSGIPLSESFYRGIASNLRNKPQGNLSDAKAATASAQAQNTQNTAVNRQMEAQQAAQIGNRNEYAEAGKVASMQNDAKNVQNIQNREGLSGSVAAQSRESTTPDVGVERARQDQQRTLASGLREKGDIWQQESTANRGLAQEYGLKSRDYEADVDRAAQIARGEGYDQPENQSDITGNFADRAGKAWNKFTDKVHDYFDEGQEGIPLPEEMPEGAVVRSGDIPSDSHVKNIRECLSDLRMKYIKEDWDKTNQIGPDDLDFLLSKLGKFKHGDREYDLNNADDWKDDTDQSVLKAYADHVKNYLYTYKPEATQIDNRIDPNEEHIGPMAQDIEQVNPACVKETPEGVKTVDTARLAMMNAGAIGDLARQLQELTDRLKALGV